MRDVDVRDALHRRLAHEHPEDDSTYVFDELGLCQQVRVDVAVINGRMSGYELKSERDTLRRLPAQVDVYSRVLDFATLVVAEKHHDHALPLLPDWWGVLLASPDGNGSVALTEVRAASENPHQDAFALAQLMWRDEALAILAARGVDRGVRTKARHYVWRRISESIPLEELREIVRTTLKERQGWRDGRR